MLRQPAGSKSWCSLLCLVPARAGWAGASGTRTSPPTRSSTSPTSPAIGPSGFIVVTLAVTPLRKLLRLPRPDPLPAHDRPVRLLLRHACTSSPTSGWTSSSTCTRSSKDVAKRPFITAGFTAFVLMLPLAVTSTTGWIRRLGGKRWQLLHRLVYLSAIAGVVHYYWLVKSDIRLPLFYGALVALLLGYRAAIALLPRTPVLGLRQSAPPSILRSRRRGPQAASSPPPRNLAPAGIPPRRRTVPPHARVPLRRTIPWCPGRFPAPERNR